MVITRQMGSHFSPILCFHHLLSLSLSLSQIRLKKPYIPTLSLLLSPYQVCVLKASSLGRLFWKVSTFRIPWLTMRGGSEFELGKTNLLPAESELELGLGLSLSSGAWRERGRILTAKDFPSVGSKRAAADSSSSHHGASPPRSRFFLF